MSHAPTAKRGMNANLFINTKSENINVYKATHASFLAGGACDKQPFQTNVSQQKQLSFATPISDEQTATRWMDGFDHRRGQRRRRRQQQHLLPRERFGQSGKEGPVRRRSDGGTDRPTSERGAIFRNMTHCSPSLPACLEIAGDL